MRIIGGEFRGRRLESPAKDQEIRPTSDRVRESLFNVLAHTNFKFGNSADGVSGAIVLDVFCGTGALGLEALSRGAAHAVFMDKSPQSIRLCGQNIATLKLEQKSRVLRSDALNPVLAIQAADLIFMDPPYAGKVIGNTGSKDDHSIRETQRQADLVKPALTALNKAGWFAPSALIVLEAPLKSSPDLPDFVVTADERKYGDTLIYFLQMAGSCHS